MDKDKVENGVSFQRADGFADGVARSIKNEFDRNASAKILKASQFNLDGTAGDTTDLNLDIKNIGSLQEHIKSQDLKDFSPLLQDAYVDKFFPAGAHILIARDSNNISVGYRYFVTNQDLIVRKDKYGKLSCDVIDNADLLGAGGQGFVYSILGSIKERYTTSGNNVMFEYGESKRIAKISVQNKQSDDEFAERIEREADLTSQCPHLKSRHTFFGSGKNNRHAGGMTMQRFGLDLLELMIQDNDSPLFTIDDRFQLTIQILEALKKQIHQQEIVHRDIKSDNICVWYDDYKWHVDIIDLGGARYHNENDKKYPGTMMYAPYETFYHKIVNESSDIFSIGIVIALLWRDMHEMALDDDLVKKDREQNDWIIPLELFDRINDLPNEFRNQIQLMLKKMLSKDQSERPTLDACIKNFKEIYQIYKHDKTASEDISVRVSATIQADKVNALFADFADKKATVNHIDEFKFALQTIYNNLPSPSGGSMIFANEQNTYCLASCRSTQDFINKTEGILNSYLVQLKDLNSLIESFSSLAADYNHLPNSNKFYSDLIRHEKELREFIGKMSSLTLNLDTIDTETAHMNRKLAKMQAARKGLESSLRLFSTKDSEQTPRSSATTRMMS